MTTEGSRVAGPGEEDLNTQIEGLDDLQIEVVDDTPEADKGRKPLAKPVDEPTDEELEQHTEGVRKRIAELTHARHDERRRREAVEREAAEQARLTQAVMAERDRLAAMVSNGEQHYIRMAQSSSAQAVAAAKAKLKAAQEAFDNDAIVEAQAELTAAVFQEQQARSMRPQMAPQQNAGQPQKSVVQPQAQPAQQADEPDENALRWQAKNQWFGSDDFSEETAFALGVHQKLVNSGMDPRSDAYFERVDARMREKFPELFAAGEASYGRSTAQNRKPPSVVAPVTRANGPRTVKLTQTQVSLAKRLGITPEQYAAEVVRMEKERANG